MSSRSRRALTLSAILLFAVGSLITHEYLRLPDGHLHIYFLDVGQGDSALIVTPSGHQIVVDGGRDDTTLMYLGRYMPLFDRSIDLLVMSHPQMDHMFSFPDILRRYTVGHILMTGVDYKLARYRELLSLIKAQHIPVWVADPTHDIHLDDGVTLDIVWPPPTLLGKEMKDVNNSSIVLRVLYQTGATLTQELPIGRAIFTGDMEEKEERAVLASGADIRADVLKVGHHGSKTSSGTGFLLAIHPKSAVISCSKDNTYGHPHKVILERFKHLGIPVHVTAWEGTVEVTY